MLSSGLKKYGKWERCFISKFLDMDSFMSTSADIVYLYQLIVFDGNEYREFIIPCEALDVMLDPIRIEDIIDRSTVRLTIDKLDKIIERQKSEFLLSKLKSIRRSIQLNDLI